MSTPEKARELLECIPLPDDDGLVTGPHRRLMGAAPDLAETVIAQAEQIADLQSRLDGQAWADLQAEVAELRAREKRVWALLERNEHVVDIRANGFGLQHGFPCRPDLLGCPVNLALEALDRAPAKAGRYLAWLDDEARLVIGQRVANDYDPLNLRAALDGAKPKETEHG